MNETTTRAAELVAFLPVEQGEKSSSGRKKRVNDQFCLLTQKGTCKGWLKGLHATLIRFTKGSPNGKKASHYST